MSKEIDRDREERRLCKKYNILFRGPAHPWPKQHSQAFQHIAVLGRYFFSDYGTGIDKLPAGERRWKSSNIGRAKRLVETASRLNGAQPSELKWRLDLEKIVYARFELEIECPETKCRGRLWRSEIEVVPEIEGSAIGKSIVARQRARVPCRCSAESVLKNHDDIPLNRVFADRVDNLIIHGGEAASELRPRKPDRVYGLQQTKRFQDVLGAITDAIGNHVAKKIGITPFDDSTDPIIFPFLISEAKSEKGDSFEASERQTAFPIWNLLCLQEQLEQESKRPMSEQGGPLVWFLANRGEDWRVYGCYIQPRTEHHRASYNIHNLWSGRVDSLDGALQLLLIVDYVFDWARDLYRSGIYRQLESLTADNLSDTRSMATDSDIYSLRPLNKGTSIDAHQRSQLMPSLPFTGFNEENVTQQSSLWVLKANEFSTTVAPSAIETDRDQVAPVPDLAQWTKFDDRMGVFRPANFINNFFECVHITTLNLKSVLWSLAKDRTKDAARTLYNMWHLDCFLVSDRFLGLLETAWTGTERASSHASNLESTKTIVATFTYRVRFSKGWVLTRYLTCLAFDATAFVLAQELAGYKSRGPTGIFGSQKLDDNEVHKLAICLEAGSLEEYFVGATKQKTKTIVKLDDPTQNFDLTSSANSLKVIEVVGKVGRTDPNSNPFESAATARRFSTKSFALDRQAISSQSSSGSGQEYTAACEVILKAGRSILLHSEPCESGFRRRNKPNPQFCLFVLRSTPQPPDLRTQIDLLQEVITSGKVFFTCHETNNPYSSALRKEEYEVLNDDLTLRKSALTWYRSILSAWKWQQPENRGKRGLEDFDTDPIHGVPIIDLEDPEYIDLKNKTDARGTASDNEWLDDADSIFVEKESPSSRKSPELMIPDRDKATWERLKSYYV